MDGAAFCPFCGEKVASAEPKPEPASIGPGVDFVQTESGPKREAASAKPTPEAGAAVAGAERPLYQADVKRPLKPTGKLMVYEDRTEFVTSSVQKAVFRYDGLVSVRKGLLDTIEFVTEDGRTEACPADRKCVHEALVYIEQASAACRARRRERLLAQGVRYSFPSNQGIMNSGVLNLSDTQAEFIAKTGKSEAVSYQDVKAVGASGGMLVFSLFGGGSRSFAVGRELLDEVTAFVADAVAPFLAARKEALLARGVYFASDGPDGGTLEILADRAEYKSRAGQVTECVPFEAVRTAELYGDMLELALTDGTAKALPVEASLAADILAFVQKAMEPYVAARTVGFDTAFGVDETIELNEGRGVFHLIRQGGKEITDEWPIEGLVRCALAEDKKLTALGSVVSGGIGLIRTAAKAAGGPANAAPAEESVGGLAVTLTVRTEQGEQSPCFYLGRSSVGMARADKKYAQCMEQWNGLSAYLQEHCPQCALAQPEIPEPETPLLEAGTQPSGTEEAAEAGSAAGAPDAPAAPDDGARREDFGISGYIEGVSRFIETCATPMTIALQGNRGSGRSSVMGMLFEQMRAGRAGGLYWVNARQLTKGGPNEALSAVAGKALLGPLCAADSASNKAGSFLTGLAGLATGIIAGDTAIGKEIAGGVLSKNPASAQTDPALLFSRQIEEKARGQNGKIIFFIDGLDQLEPAKAVELLEAMRDYLECKKCVFVIAANYREILRGAQERLGESRAKRFFDDTFKMTFRVPASSINLKGYARGKLEEMGLSARDDAELELYAALIAHSVGKNIEAMDRLFVSFHLLKDMAGGDVCADARKRLALFALLCMQARFRDAYDYAMQQKENVTPAFLAVLCGRSAQPWDGAQTNEEREAYQGFGDALASVIDLDGRMEISEAECRAFAAALELSGITSR